MWAAQLCEMNAGMDDLVIGIGGGSAIDLAKAVAAMATNRESSSAVDYLESVGRGYKISSVPLPMLAIPTTAGTGSKATKTRSSAATIRRLRKACVRLDGAAHRFGGSGIIGERQTGR